MGKSPTFAPGTPQHFFQLWGCGKDLDAEKDSEEHKSTLLEDWGAGRRLPNIYRCFGSNQVIRIRP